MAVHDLSGLLVIDKPRGLTSFDVVAQVRRVFGQKKIGHAGTLDPNVDGVLVLALGKATKLIDLLQTRPKTYRGEITLGFTTETEDSDGAVVVEKPLGTPVDVATIDQGLQKLTGDIKQVPPMYSAVKVAGRRLYEYARLGLPVQRPERFAHVYEFKRVDQPVFNQGQQSFHFTATVSKGTYIRTLAGDFGTAVGWPATMTALTRTAGSGFELAQSVNLADLKEMDQQQAAQLLRPIESVLDWPIHELSSSEWFAVKNGQKMTGWSPDQSEYLQLYYQGELKMVYHYSQEEQLWRSRYVFNNQA